MVRLSSVMPAHHLHIESWNRHAATLQPLTASMQGQASKAASPEDSVQDKDRPPEPVGVMSCALAAWWLTVKEGDEEGEEGHRQEPAALRQGLGRHAAVEEGEHHKDADQHALGCAEAVCTHRQVTLKVLVLRQVPACMRLSRVSIMCRCSRCCTPCMVGVMQLKRGQ